MIKKIYHGENFIVDICKQDDSIILKCTDRLTKKSYQNIYNMQNIDYSIENIDQFYDICENNIYNFSFGTNQILCIKNKNGDNPFINIKLFLDHKYHICEILLKLNLIDQKFKYKDYLIELSEKEDNVIITFHNIITDNIYQNIFTKEMINNFCLPQYFYALCVNTFINLEDKNFHYTESYILINVNCKDYFCFYKNIILPYIKNIKINNLEQKIKQMEDTILELKILLNL